MSAWPRKTADGGTLVLVALRLLSGRPLVEEKVPVVPRYEFPIRGQEKLDVSLERCLDRLRSYGIHSNKWPVNADEKRVERIVAPDGEPARRPEAQRIRREHHNHHHAGPERHAGFLAGLAHAV